MPGKDTHKSLSEAKQLEHIIKFMQALFDEAHKTLVFKKIGKEKSSMIIRFAINLVGAKKFNEFELEQGLLGAKLNKNELERLVAYLSNLDDLDMEMTPADALKSAFHNIDEKTDNKRWQNKCIMVMTKDSDDAPDDPMSQVFYELKKDMGWRAEDLQSLDAEIRWLECPNQIAAMQDVISILDLNFQTGYLVKFLTVLPPAPQVLAHYQLSAESGDTNQMEVIIKKNVSDSVKVKQCLRAIQNELFPFCHEKSLAAINRSILSKTEDEMKLLITAAFAKHGLADLLLKFPGLYVQGTLNAFCKKLLKRMPKWQPHQSAEVLPDGQAKSDLPERVEGGILSQTLTNTEKPPTHDRKVAFNNTPEVRVYELDSEEPQDAPVAENEEIASTAGPQHPPASSRSLGR